MPLIFSEYYLVYVNVEFNLSVPQNIFPTESSKKKRLANIAKASQSTSKMTSMTYITAKSICNEWFPFKRSAYIKEEKQTRHGADTIYFF